MVDSAGAVVLIVWLGWQGAQAGRIGPAGEERKRVGFVAGLVVMTGPVEEIGLVRELVVGLEAYDE